MNNFNTPKSNGAPAQTPSPEVLLENQLRQAQETASMRAEFRRIQQQLADMAVSRKDDSPSPRQRRSHAPKLKEKKKKNPQCDLHKVDLTDISKKLKDSCHLLMRSLMCRTSGQSPLPPPPEEYYSVALQKFIPADDFPDNESLAVLSLTDLRTVSDLDGKIDRDYIDFIHMSMRRWNLRFFTMDWNANFEDRFNQISCQFFIKVWKWGLTLGRFGSGATEEYLKIKHDEMILMAIVWKHVEYLRSNYKKLTKNSEALKINQAKNSVTVALMRKSESRQKTLLDLGVEDKYIDVFDNRHCNSDDDFEQDPNAYNVRVRYSKIPYWRSEIATRFVDWVEDKSRASARVRITGVNNRAKVGPAVIPRARRVPPVVDEAAVVPAKLPKDWYSDSFLADLNAGQKEDLNFQPPFFPESGDFDGLIPKGEHQIIAGPSDAAGPSSGEFDHLLRDDAGDINMKQESDEEL